MKLKIKIFIALFSIALIIAGIFTFYNIRDYNPANGASLIKKIIKTGSPVVKWYGNERVFKFLLIFKDGFVAGGESIFLGAITPNTKATISCAYISDYKCANAELVKLEFVKRK